MHCVLYGQLYKGCVDKCKVREYVFTFKISLLNVYAFKPNVCVGEDVLQKCISGCGSCTFLFLKKVMKSIVQDGT